ncbi:hypothetical protein PMI14_05816 [Acidovorax sp. CF316]|uniref:hypothetical protein n=1 Tax=Acidovorax sp. CF316 TaxID=1144317 RepID=UPI00026BC7E8|nr:hypothetical protein [Acidovorax sp. CF316]EJE49573.1 hypothetical protein PMI14_05816 [Acidovorax sp. CF316]
MTERKADLKFGVDATAVKPGLEQIKRDVKGMSEDVKRSGKEGSEGIEKIGGGSDNAAKKVESATRAMQASLQRQIAAFEAGSKSSRQYQESLIKMRGGDLAALKPLLDQLDAARDKAEAAARANKKLGDSAAAAGQGHDQLAKRINVLGTAADFARGQLLALASGLSLGALAAWVQHINDGVDALNDIKDATGASIENISALEDVGRRTGASFETVGSILVKFNDVLSKATPKSDIANAIKAIGLEADALKKLDPAEALRVVAVALAGFADDANKARLIQDLFGKSVKEAAPFLTDLAEKTELTAKRFTSQTDAAEAFNKKIFDLKATSNDLSRDLVEKMLPGLTQIIDAMGKGAKEGGALLAVWRGLREFGSIALGTDKLGTAMSDAKAQAAELKRLDLLLTGARTTADLDPKSAMAQRRVESLRAQIQATSKAATEASARVSELLNGPAPAPDAAKDGPKDKPSIKTPKTAAEIAAGEAAAKKAADERKKALQEEAKLLAELAGLSGSFADDWEKLNAAYRGGRMSIDQLTEAQKKLLEKQPFMQAQRKQEAEDIKTATEAAKQRVDAYNKEVDGIEKWLESQAQLSTQTVKGIEDRIAAMDQEEEALALAERHNISLAEAINRVRVARLREKRDGSTGYYEGSDEWNRITSEINALDTEADRINAKDRRDKTRDDNLRAKEEIDRWIDDTGRGLGDAVEVGIRDGSEAGGKKMREVLQEQLLRKPFRMVIDAAMNQVVGGLLQMVGIGGGAAGGAGGLGSLFSMGSSLYSGYSGLTSGQGVLGSIGNAFGLGGSSAGLAASNAASAANGLSALPATNVGSFGGVGSGVVGQGGTYTATGAGGGGMGALGAAGMWVMIAYAIANAIGVNRKREVVGTGLTGTLGGDDLTPWENTRKPGTVLMGPEYRRVNPLDWYEDLKKRDQEYVAKLKEQGGKGTLVGSPYGTEFNGTQAMQTPEYLEEIENLAASSKRQSDEIQKGYVAVRKSAVDMANSLGLAGDKLKDWTVALKPEDLNFKDLNEQQISEKIAKVFGDAGTGMARQVLGTWITETIDVVNSTLVSQLTDTTEQVYDLQVDQVTRTRYVASEYAKAGETAFETLTRLSTSFHTLNEASDALGFGIHQGSLALADFADDFIEAFGGLERFTTQSNAFLQNFYSDDKRREAAARSAARSAERLGLQGITAEGILQVANTGNTQAVVDAVNSLVSNPELYGDAMEWANGIAWLFQSSEAAAPAVQDLGNAIDELTQSYQNAVKSLTSDRDSLAVEVLRAQGDEKGAKALERTQYMAQFAGLDEVRRKEIETLYDGNMATRAYIEGIKAAAQAQLDALAKLRADSLALIDAAAGKTDAAMAAYERAADKERERLQGVIDATRAVFQAAEDGAKSFFSQVDEVAKFQGQEGRAFITQALASVRAGGELPDGQKLSDAIAAVGQGFAATQYATQAEADFQRLVVANELKGLQEASGDQLDTAEAQLKALNDQSQWAREQVDALRGIDSKLKTLPEAIAALIAAYNGESQTRSNVGAKAIIGTGSAIYDKTKGAGLTSSGEYFDASDMAAAAAAVIAANPGGSGKASVLDALEGKGYTMPQYNEMFGLPPGTLEAEAKALGRPIFHAGTPYVPETGYALLQRGEMVIPTAYNPNAHGRVGGDGVGSSARVEALLAMLIERVSALEAPLTNIDSQTSETREILDRVTEGGNSMKSDVMNEVTLAA